VNPDRRPTAARLLHALLTEHFFLESARGITVSESSSRSSLHLMTFSSALVAFGFLAASPYALGSLSGAVPVVFILGVFTYVRLVQTSLEDVAALASTEKIRRFYGTLLPGAAASSCPRVRPALPLQLVAAFPWPRFLFSCMASIKGGDTRGCAISWQLRSANHRSLTNGNFSPKLCIDQ
jgi:hypothetical protein